MSDGRKDFTRTLSFYFIYATITTVGYGDVAGKQLKQVYLCLTIIL